ncbi:MAG: translation elongation factor Ts [bacterium]|nr:translation elongation factor Ts [bacterium]
MSSGSVQKLREETGAGVMECKRALDEAGDDFEKAKKIIHEKGIARAEKKGDRATGAGLIEAYIHNGRVGVLLELRAETDFALRSEQVKSLVKNLLFQISAMAPANVEDLLKQPYIKDDSITIETLIENTIAQVGENLKVAQFARFQI